MNGSTSLQLIKIFLLFNAIEVHSFVYAFVTTSKRNGDAIPDLFLFSVTTSSICASWFRPTRFLRKILVAICVSITPAIQVTIRVPVLVSSPKLETHSHTQNEGTQQMQSISIRLTSLNEWTWECCESEKKTTKTVHQCFHSVWVLSVVCLLTGGRTRGGCVRSISFHSSSFKSHFPCMRALTVRSHFMHWTSEANVLRKRACSDNETEDKRRCKGREGEKLCQQIILLQVNLKCKTFFIYYVTGSKAVAGVSACVYVRVCVCLNKFSDREIIQNSQSNKILKLRRKSTVPSREFRGQFGWVSFVYFMLYASVRTKHEEWKEEKKNRTMSRRTEKKKWLKFCHFRCRRARKTRTHATCTKQEDDKKMFFFLFKLKPLIEMIFGWDFGVIYGTGGRCVFTAERIVVVVFRWTANGSVRIIPFGRIYLELSQYRFPRYCCLCCFRFLS